MIFTLQCSPFVSLVAICLTCLALGFRPDEARGADLKLEVRLIWGTNDNDSPVPTHKRIDTPLTRKLAKLFTWKQYFEVNRQEVVIPLSAVKKLELSEKCIIEVKNVGDTRIEVKLFGGGKFVSKTVETIPKGDWLVLAGDSAGRNAWFIVLKTIEPKGFL